ncbi:Fe-S cluster assembly protein SufD [Euzebya tangerina]|uniref:Fe-S cluster assembly protein SufD n=1 Tax=Euzebya tangerina TaxID=591198 RepID=UPI000E322CC3|nr:Fe-S cluster assembly protein SufD [Euzebya tangerina]
MPNPLTLTETDVLAISDAADDPAWLRDRRSEAFKAFSDLEWPTVRDEDWRFTNPARIPLDREILTSGVDVPALADGSFCHAAEAVAGLVRLVDGGVQSAEAQGGLPEGVIVTDLATAAREHPELVQQTLGSVVGNEEIFAATTHAAWTAGAFVHVPHDVEVEGTLVVTIQAVTPGTHVQHVVVSLGRHAKASVLVEQVGSTDATVLNTVEAVVGDGATLNLVTAQNWGAGIAHVTTHRGKVGRDATYQQTEITLGGDTVYARPDVWLAERGGSGELLGVYFPTGTEKIEHRSLIFHDADHTTSDYVHKGALSDQAHATWYGNIRIDIDAKQTVSDETNRNLILSPGAKADTLPFLEIETADVAACGHHSSVGQVDEVQLWYLQSRGISRDEAARMLVFAFFTEVLDRVAVSGITETVLADITAAVREAPATLMDPRRTAIGRSASVDTVEAGTAHVDTTGTGASIGSADAGAPPADFGGGA